MGTARSWAWPRLPFAQEPKAAPALATGTWDCHCHILPGMDDGPTSLDEAVAMVRMAEASGTRFLIATPHHIQGLYPTRGAEVLAALDDLQRQCAANDIEVHLLPGQELALSPDIPARLRTGELLTLGGAGRAVLVELPPLEPPPYWKHTFFELRLNGVTPIIAHAERTALVGNAELAAEMVAAGAALQINGSALHRKGPLRRTLDNWLRRGWVACLGSDAHDLRRRPPVLTVPDNLSAWRNIALTQPRFLSPGSTVSA